MGISISSLCEDTESTRLRQDLHAAKANSKTHERQSVQAHITINQLKASMKNMQTRIDELELYKQVLERPEKVANDLLSTTLNKEC